MSEDEVSHLSRTDEAIRGDVLRELKRLSCESIRVVVHRGAVSLSGNVDRWSKVTDAQATAHGVAGVLDVVNDVEVSDVEVAGSNDLELAITIRSALLWDADVPDEAIRSTVSWGVVTLEGQVETERARADAERVVCALTGVEEVRNCIRVAPGAMPKMPG